jgi:ribonuclease-3
MDSQGDTEEDIFKEFSRQHGLNFSNVYHLRRAMTHRSYLNEHPEVLEDNERLEFLGDAVLDFLVAAWLYHHFPDFHEGQLTRYRAALVGNDQLAEFSRRLDLGLIMRLGKGEHENGGRERSALLGSTFEALIGALYLDQGIQVVQVFVVPFLESIIDQIVVDGRDIDAKSLLQEWAQAQGLGAPIYPTVDSYGPDHARIFIVEVVIGEQVYGRGEGRSKQAAAKAAAKAALNAQGLL